MNLVPLPAFADNYIWMLYAGSHTIVVDPGDEKPVFDFLERMQLQLAAILVTHHHADHTGGVNALRTSTAPRSAMKVRAGARALLASALFYPCIFDIT